jgi:hypothetical protein
MRHTTDERVLDAHRAVLAWLDAEMPEQPRDALWETVEAVVAAAERRRRRAGAAAAAWASLEAVGAAATAVRAAAAEATVAGRRRGAADRIIDAILTALEKECGL